ncbi:HelD family protein [Clostridium sp. DL1XJH146]
MNNGFENEIMIELEKERQKELEEDYLNKTINLIREEIIRFIEKRKKAANYIRDYRKEAMDEYKDDEDEVTKYFDHERFYKEESFSYIDRKLKELSILKDSPYYGKVEFVDEEYDELENIYIGRFGVTIEESNEPIVVDWRAPIASLFYAGKLGNIEYKAPVGSIPVKVTQKRQFIIKAGKLLGMFDSDIEVKDDILQMMLAKNTGDKLKDIIMTIQGEQDDIIRKDRKKTIVVNGVAGSGKTTIALHRIAYLLYNYREILQDKLMILGPNRIFMEYISEVLPSLGEIGVNQATFQEFALEILDLDKIMETNKYMEKVFAKDEEFLNTIKTKTSKEFIVQLDRFVSVLNDRYFIFRDLNFGNSIFINKEVIQELFLYYKNMPLFRRNKKIKRILYSKILEERDNQIRKIKTWYENEMEKIKREDKEEEAPEIEYKRKLKIRDVIRNVINAKKSLDWLENESVVHLYSKLMNADEFTIDDLAPMLYLKNKLEGFVLDEELKYVVIDEAQDYSELQFIVIKEITGCKSYTIVGDSNQRLLTLNEEIPFLELNNFYDNVELYNLDKSYRSTQEIMEYANKFLDNKIVPLVRNGDSVLEKEFAGYDVMAQEIIDRINSIDYKDYGSIAIICRDLKTSERISLLIKQKMPILLLDKEDILFKKGVVILPAYYAKGLEFDAVILVEEDSLEFQNNKIKYIMATRALHKLEVYNLKKED